MFNFREKGININDFCYIYFYSVDNAKNYYKGKDPLRLFRHYELCNGLNFWLAILLIWILKLPFLWVCVSFVVTDFVLCSFDGLLFKKDKGHKTNVIKQQKYVEKLNADYDKGYELTVGRSNKQQIETSMAYRYFYDYILEEKDYLNTLLKETEVKKVKSDSRLSKDYEDKQEYITSVVSRVKLLEPDYACLTTLRESLETLQEVLKQKPDAIVELPRTLLIYLDELQGVTAKLVTLPSEDKSQYEDQFLEIVRLLTENVDFYVEKVRKFDRTNIEVSLSVLLSELQSQREEE